LVPLKTIGKLILNALVGAIVLLLINFAGQGIGIYIAVNPLTALVTGFLGVPGVALLLALQIIL
jgi:inhibitor of the pro-sigma K processing machinery